MKPGPGFLYHLASTRGPGAKGRGHWITHRHLLSVLHELNLRKAVLLGPRSVDQRLGVTVPNS